MPLTLFVRHGLTALTGPVLAGWTPGVHLDERGRGQAERLGEQLRAVPLAAIVTSPLERCRETADALAATHPDTPLYVDDRVGECRYGEWTGRQLRELAREPLWRTVQTHPSAVTFPGGESLRDIQSRAVGAVREWNERVGPDATYAVVSHGDVIKAILADALGLHLDSFQRLLVDPCSLSAVRYTELRPFLVRLNDSGGDVSDLLPPRRRGRRRRASDAVVGGSAGGRPAGPAPGSA